MTPAGLETSGALLNSARADFPILKREVHGHPVVYLDSAATTQKPSVVLEALQDYYELHNSNVHRGVHLLSQEATEAYEGAREIAREFLGAKSTKEIIFVRGTTEAINLVAQSYGRPRLAPGDEVLITHMEHHSNIVPWQLLCEQTGATLKVLPIDETGSLVVEKLAEVLTERTKIVSVVHASNSLGTINPIAEITRAAHSVGAVVVVDGAQGGGHLPLNLDELGCDFYAISGHKMFAPTGIGVLWGREELLESMAPYQGGGDMIRSVTFEKTTYNDLPYKFEAGTPNIAGAIGLGAAMKYIESLGREQIHAHEAELVRYGTEKLEAFSDIRLVGTAPQKSGVLSFVVEGIHPHDIGTILDHQGIAVRTGHHCTQPIMDFFKVPATVRASMSVYNDPSDLDRLVEGLNDVRKTFGRSA